MRLADKIATMARRGGGVPVEYRDGYRYLSTGASDAASGCSIVLNFIPVVWGHSYTVHGGGGGSTNRYGIWHRGEGIYGSFSQTKASEEVTVTAPSYAGSMRFTIYTNQKDEVFVYDNTDGRYIVKDGVLLVSTEGGY